MIEYGRIGTMYEGSDRGGAGAPMFDFMVIGLIDEFQSKGILNCIIIKGGVIFQGKPMGVGDIGPVKANNDMIEWLDDD